ncbi:MAG: hypothetical protein LH618_14695, partial [Saprospiraceae bacterium]|nr:hypothetical protein [Saprospiraceae bacterium]
MVIIFTLFVGSMVNERIIDFIKLQIPDLWLKAFNYKEELKRCKRLWLLAFFMGIVTTTILNINLITLLKNQVPETGSLLQELTEWAKKAENKNVALAVSWIVTALFISLGSKFWHDLLDLVLFLKNSKRKIENFESEEVADIKAVEKYLSENDYEIAQKTLQANLETLRKNYPDASLNIG